MRTESNTEKNFTTGIICSAPWRLSRVKPHANYTLEVEFMDGTQGFVDMSRFIQKPTAGVFAVLKDKDLFEQVFLEYGAVTWPTGLDLAPDAMYEAIKHHGKWVLE
jgi:hypothetical protein